jgi:hypothetical protein
MIPGPAAASGSELFSIPVKVRPPNVPYPPHALFPLAIDLVHQAQERRHRLGDELEHCRSIAFTDFHCLPGTTPERDTMLDRGDLILAIEVPTRAELRRHHLP